MALVVGVFVLATALVLLLVVRELSTDQDSQLSAALAAQPPPSFARANQGWLVSVAAPSGAAGFRYRTGDDAWSQTVQSWFMLPSWQRATTLQIAFVDASGKQSAPYSYPFEPAIELAQSTRRNLEQAWPGWVAFRPWADKTLIYFTNLVTQRCGLSEVHYGLDGAAPTTPFELPPCRPFDSMPGAIGADVRPYIEAPSSTRSISVDLTYFDGTHSQTRTFQAETP